jgi:hypothetical protein
LKSLKGLFLLLGLLIIALFIVFRPWDYYHLATEGMAAIANNTEDYTDQNGQLLKGQYSVVIDLSDLESNVGKELYNDGTNKIVVLSVDNTGNANSGGYRISFRSKGTYSYNGASLISGVQHKTVSEHSFTMDMSAKMTATYKNKYYESSVFGTGGINYKDGDDFAFYIFPYEAYDQEITLQETGTVQLNVTDLYNNSWSKK